jgi:hypothetical protein
MDNEYKISIARDGSYFTYLGLTENYENMLMFLSKFEPDIFQLEDGI